MSNGLGLATILGCLQAGEKVAGLLPQDWTPDPKAVMFAKLQQRDFLLHQLGLRPSMKVFGSELKAFATTVHPDVIATMHEWKMKIDDLPAGGPGSVYMISQLKEMLMWKVPGERVTRDDISWPEFVLKEHVEFFSYKSGDANNIVVRVEVENGDFVFFTNMSPTFAFDIWLLADQIEAEMKPARHNYGGVQIPCIDADIEADLSWIIGMRNNGYYISYAQQKIRFGMNELGFAVQEDTGMMFEKCCLQEPYILSQNGEPFLMWRRRAGVNFPISMFEFSRDDFKDPGELAKIIE